MGRRRHLGSQHQELVNYMNSWYDLSRTGQSVLANVSLQQLLAFTVKHFSFEEQMMKNHGYADYDNFHIYLQIHRLSQTIVDQMECRYSQGKMEECLDDIENLITCPTKPAKR